MKHTFCNIICHELQTKNCLHITVTHCVRGQPKPAYALSPVRPFRLSSHDRNVSFYSEHAMGNLRFGNGSVGGWRKEGGAGGGVAGNNKKQLPSWLILAPTPTSTRPCITCVHKGEEMPLRPRQQRDKQAENVPSMDRACYTHGEEKGVVCTSMNRASLSGTEARLTLYGRRCACIQYRSSKIASKLLARFSVCKNQMHQKKRHFHRN